MLFLVLFLTFCCCFILVIIIIFDSQKHDPEGFQKLDRLQKFLSWNTSLCLPINKAVMQQNSIKTLNQH